MEHLQYGKFYQIVSAFDVHDVKVFHLRWLLLMTPAEMEVKGGTVLMAEPTNVGHIQLH